MTDNVRHLSIAPSSVKPVDDEVLDLLASLTRRAEAGELQGLLVATVESDGAGSVLGVGTAYAGEGVRQNVHAAMGAAETLKLRFARERIEEL